MPQLDRPDEFSLIAKVFAPLSAEAPGAFGLTDDAAVFCPGEGMELVLTVDAIVEGVHFLASDPAGSVAQKLLRVNLSDLAAKGASPRGYLLVTSWRADTTLAWIEEFADGLRRDQQSFGIALWGGDTVSTPGPLSFSLTAIGEVPRGRMLRRSGANVGDDIYVSGTIGDGALGLAAAEGQLGGALDDVQWLVDRYRCPHPRNALGPRLIGLASASLDISDGLMADLTHLCECSAVGARIEAPLVPLSPAAIRAVEANSSWFGTALTGGDDYELLFTAPPAKAALIEAAARETGTPVTRIGVVVSPEEGINAVDSQGSPITFGRLGFKHF
ncbi:thiamine-phosphate kinase [Parvibaculum sp.]|uniref:thiamine-phosphate kinase n=1 Tax=Parvibaculum sp. TaxID=2024848 RepID=UPI003210BE39